MRLRPLAGHVQTGFSDSTRARAANGEPVPPFIYTDDATFPRDRSFVIPRQLEPPARLPQMSNDVRAEVVADLESRRSATAGAMAADRVVVDWVGPGTGPFIVRKRDFEFVVDEPTERGGTDTAPNPLAYFLAGAASCLANHYVSLALSEDISLRGLSVIAVGRFDRVLIGGAFRDISYDVRIETDEPAVRIQELAERADVMCVASNTLANAGVILTTRIFVNGVTVATMRRDGRA